MHANRIGSSIPGRSASRYLFALMAAGWAAGCSGGSPPETTTVGSLGAIAEELPPALQLQLDSGNVAYRDRQYDEALRHFDTVVRMDPQLAAGWYGLGMTYGAIGNAAAADSAMAQVHVMDPDISLEHPIAQAPPNPHPSIPPEIVSGRP
jgi:tetratricopeptide (TPR) repeat protein